MRKKAGVLIAAILLLTTNLRAIAFGQPDSTLISMTLKEAPIEKAFSLLKDQSSYRVMYSDALLKNALPVTISVNKAAVRTVLDILFRDQPFGYRIVDDRIIVTPKEKKAFFPANVEARDSIITGMVKDRDGKPLPGVTVTVRSTGRSVVTDEDGQFSIAVMQGQALVFSAINLETKEIKVGSSLQELSVVLVPKVLAIDSVTIVSTGYQDIPKERATGSFVQINNELLNRSVSTNVLDRIKDITSGLLFDPRSIGTPNKSPFTIRGVSTINGNVYPLIVIDGFPYDESVGHAIVNNINPNDIQSITILKDAAAASIWGVRAGNGVVVITTKKGKFNQKPQVQFNSNVTISAKPDLTYIPVMSSAEVIDVEKQLFNNGTYQVHDDSYPSFGYFKNALPEVAEILLSVRRNDLSQTDADSRIAQLVKQDIRKDISTYLLQHSTNQQYALNISGGSDKMSYYGSVGYDKGFGSSIGNQSSRITLRLDNTFRPVKNLEVNFYINYVQTRQINNGISYAGLMAVGGTSVTPYTQLADANGNALAIPYRYRLAYVDTAHSSGLLDWHYKPLNELELNDNVSNSNTTRVGTSVKYTFIHGLSAEVKYQYQKLGSNNRIYYSPQSFTVRDLINSYSYVDPINNIHYPVPIGGVLDRNTSELTSWNWRAQVNYSGKWGRHELTTLAGSELSQSDYDTYYNRWYGYDPSINTFNTFIDYVNSYNLRATFFETGQIPSNNYYVGTLNRLLSFYANGAYAYASKYTFSISGRKDGANLFGVKTNDKITPLWSAGFAWDVYKENFYHIRWLPYIKLRTTYGYNGNLKSNATTYATMQYSGSDPRTGAIWAQISTPPNPSLHWEKVRVMNLGMDFETIHSRISGSIEFYRKTGLDLISPVKIETTTGWDTYTGNNASIKGYGWDIVVNSRNIDKRFKWQTTLLFSTNTDNVTTYQQEPTVNSLFGTNTPYVGHPLNSIYSYRWAGLDPFTGSPRGYVADTITLYNIVISGTNTKASNLVYNGPAIPRVFGSIRNAFSFRGFSLSFNIGYKLDYYFRRSSINYSSLYAMGWGGHSDFALRWQKTGDENITNVPSVPNLSAIDPGRDQFYQWSSILVEKGDHIRLQDIRIGYDFNKQRFKNLPVHSMQLYVYANNLGILWKANKLGIDPDYGDNNIPSPRSIAFGLNVSF